MSVLTNFQRIEQSVQFIRLKAFHAYDEFRNHPRFSEMCVEFILMNQHVAKATVPMMQEVVNCSNNIADDPVSAPLIKYMQKHIAEETDHDEWYLDDLEVLGLSRDEAHSRIPTPNTAAMIGSQYYWIKHYHPVAFLGYMGSVETYPSPEQCVKDMIKESGLPEKGFDTLLMHAQIDIHHGKDIIDLINTLPLTELHLKIIERSAFQTFRYTALMLDDLVNSLPIKNKAIA